MRSPHLLKASIILDMRTFRDDFHLFHSELLAHIHYHSSQNTKHSLLPLCDCSISYIKPDRPAAPQMQRPQQPPVMQTSTPAFLSASLGSPLASYVLNSLKYETLAKLSSSLSRSRFLNSGMEGFEASELVVRGRCDLHTFLSIVNYFKHCPTSTIPNSFRLNPTCSAFINPSRATNLLSIDFESLIQLLVSLDVRDSTDHHRASMKSTSKKNGSMLRLLGSTCTMTVNSSSPSTPPVVLDCVLPSFSFTSTIHQHLHNAFRTFLDCNDVHQQGFDDNEDVHPVLFRERRNYDPVQGRYLSAWKMLHLRLRCFHTSSTVGTEQYRSNDSTFSVQWTQLPVLSPSSWTSDGRFFGQHVLGELNVFFPCVTFVGETTIAEIQTLLHDCK